MLKFAIYLNGFDALSLGGAAILKTLKDQGIIPERIYTCGINSIFATDYAAQDEYFEKRVLSRLNVLSKKFKSLMNISKKDLTLAKLTDFYKIMSTTASKKIKGMVKEKFVTSKLGSLSKPKMDIMYSAVNILNTSEVLISRKEWRAGLRASIAIVPIFAPAEYRGHKFVSTTTVTGVPGFSTLESEGLLKIFVNTMPHIPDVLPKRTWEIMLKADYARTMFLIDHFSKKFDFFLDFSKYREKISDFSLNSWNNAKEIARSVISNSDVFK